MFSKTVIINFHEISVDSINYLRPLRYATRTRVAEELGRHPNLEDTKPVDYTGSGWTAPVMAIISRHCVDHSTVLSEELLPQDIFSTVNDTRVFTHIDLSEVYFLFLSVMDSIIIVGRLFAFAYFDDIVIVVKNASKHNSHIPQIDKFVIIYSFRTRLEKRLFFENSIKYLGFAIDKNGRPSSGSS